MSPSMAALLLASSLCAAAGQILLKIGATGRDSLVAFFNGPVILGLAAYAVGLLLWLVALSRLPLYVVYPFTFLTLIWVGALSYLVLGERPAPMALAGWAAVAVGLMIIWASTRSV
ncbi:MAG: hypothetical protein N2444_01845 [Methylocystis sp.]|nr:hypothetical protein [Methylocystis sp.]